MAHHGAQILPMEPASTRASLGSLRRRWGSELGLASWEGLVWGLLVHLLPTVCITDTRCYSGKVVSSEAQFPGVSEIVGPEAGWTLLGL